MTRSHALRASAAIAALVFAWAPATTARDDAGDLMRRAQRDAEAGRFVAADSGYARAAEIAEGDERAEALFRRAGVVRSGTIAESLYRTILDEYGEGEWGRPAALELAKIQFAMGRYESARGVLAGADLCAWSDEACVFDGMAAIMLRRFDEAAAPLSSVKRGRHKTWATISLAEAEEGMGHEASACERYAGLARARVHPTAWLRHTECLDAAGDAEGGKRELEALADAFPYSPEALRASAKLSPPPPQAAATPSGDAAASGVEPAQPPLGGTGFTIQFGSFADRGNAIKLAAKIKKTYPGVRIDSELVNYREVFRVRYGQYATRGEAQTAGETMTRELDERYTVMPVTRAADE
ncbi:MAG TPA: SPOR domain-containing protein [Candidatus Krumholzibacteria bacterium]|nr:SPOR domain-containing protein [Candidatus Krumholzibacteria bacterium]